MQKPTPEQALYYLKLLRSARYKVLSDAENFRDVCFALEELGTQLLGKKKNGLGAYQAVLLEFIGESEGGDFASIFEAVRTARNDDAHEGVYARNSASRAIDLSIRFEEQLLKNTREAKHIMSDSVIFAEPYYTLAKLRRIMLANSFSYLPIKLGGTYYILDDLSLSEVWYGVKHDSRHTKPFTEFIDIPRLPVAVIFSESAKINDLLKHRGQWPILVTDRSEKVVGIITPFDLL